MKKIRYGLFFDNHTHVDNPDVGKDFDAEYFTDQLKRCGVNYLGFHARCNQGLAYYDTKIGTRHPALDYDLFGNLTEACKRKDIAVAAYFNGGISTMEAVAHPEWRTMYFPGKDKFTQIDPFSLTMCYNSPYRDHLLAMISEVAQNYPVDGFFIDCLSNFPCVCPRCVESMKKHGLDCTNADDVYKHGRLSVLDFCKDITDTVKKFIPEPLLYFNGPAFGAAKDMDTFFDCECLPGTGWGYEFLPLVAHYGRNITKGKQVLNMTGRFYDWGDFGGLRNRESLEFDLLYGVSHNMRPNIGGHIHPRGDKDQPIFDRINELYSFLQTFDQWHIDAENLADTAIVYNSDVSNLRGNKSVLSAVRMLDELKIQFDIVFADCEKSWDQYKLLILPDNVEMTDLLSQKIRKHIRQGKAFFSCGASAAQTFSNELGIIYKGEYENPTVYYSVKGNMAKNTENIFHSLYVPAAEAKITDAEFIAPIVKAYCKPEWTGTYAKYYIPPDKESNIPFLTKKQNCIWCAGDIFSGYNKCGALHLKTLFKNIISEIASPFLLENISLPSFVRTSVTRQSSRINVNIIAYAPERRGQTCVVEDAMAVLDGRFKLHLPSANIKSVTLAPNGTPLEHTVNDSTVEIALPPFKGFALAVIELAE